MGRLLDNRRGEIVSNRDAEPLADAGKCPPTPIGWERAGVREKSVGKSQHAVEFTHCALPMNLVAADVRRLHLFREIS